MGSREVGREVEGTTERESREWEVQGAEKENLFERKWFVIYSTVESRTGRFPSKAALPLQLFAK